MKIKSLIFLAVLAVSCKGVQPEAIYKTVLEAGICESKTALGDKSGSTYSIFWTSSDVLCVNGNNSTSVSVKSDARQASFTFSGTLNSPYNAICPASAVKSYSAGTYSIDLPAVQGWTEGGYDPAAAVICGTGSNADVTLSNAMAFLRIVPTNANSALRLRKIVVSAPEARLSGSFTVDCSTAALTPASGSAAVTVDCGESGIAFGTPVIVAIPAGVYSNGIALRIIDTDSHFQDIRSSASFTAAGGIMYKTSPSYVPAGTLLDGDTGSASDGEEGVPGPFGVAVRIGIMGDSISTFKGWIPSQFAAYYPHTNSTNGKSLTEVEQTWWYRLIYDLMPCAELDKNLSYSGSFVTKLDDGKARDEWTFPTRCEMYQSPDIIILHGGTNDRGVSRGAMVPLGTYDYGVAVDQLDIRAFRSAYIKTILQLQANYPGVKIVCLINSVLYKENLEDETKNYKLLGESIQTIADHYNLPVVSLKDLSYGTLDGLHPDPDGSLVIANLVYTRLAQEGLLNYKRPVN